MNFGNDVASTMAQAVKHRISGFDVKSPYSQQQLPPLSPLPEASPAIGPSTSYPTHASPWASNSLPQQEAEGGIRFHDWFSTKGQSPHSRSVPGGTSRRSTNGGGEQGNGQRAEGVKAFQDMCSASRSMAAVDSPTMLRKHRVEVVGTTHTAAGVRRLIRSVTQGLRACQEPERAEAGLGGTYFFKNENGVKIAIVKPLDEEPLAPNNPKGFVGRELGDPGLKPTVRVGEAALREVAAFLLDYQGFAKVPATVLVRVTHPIFHVAAPLASPVIPFGGQTPATDASPESEASCMPPTPTSPESSSTDAPPSKLGSLQEFVSHVCDTSEMGASRFAVADVHRIGILDVRLYNTDRHAGNMLVRRPRTSVGGGGGSGLARLAEARLELCPIDHGFCLPEGLEPPYLEWMHWPQAMIPFDDEELAYIAALDPDADVELLRRELPSLRDSCLRTLEVSTTLLRACAAAGLSLSEIGTVMSRPLVGFEEDPSELERLCLRVREAVSSPAISAQLDDGDGLWSSDSGGSDDSNSEVDSEGPVTPRAMPVHPLHFAGTGEGGEKLTHFQRGVPAFLPASDTGSSRVSIDGRISSRDSVDRRISCGESLLGVPPLVPAPLSGKSSGFASATNTLGRASESNSFRGMGTLASALDSPQNGDSDRTSSSACLGRASGSSGDGSAYGPVSQQSGDSGVMPVYLGAYACAGATLAEGGVGRPGSGNSGRADDLLFDFDDGGARNGSSAAHTPRVGSINPSPFNSPSPRQKVTQLSTPNKRTVGGVNTPQRAIQHESSPDGGTPLSYSRYAAASLYQGATAGGFGDFGPAPRRSRSSQGMQAGMSENTRPLPVASGRAMHRILVGAPSLSSGEDSYGSRDSGGLESGKSMMAMSLAVPTPMRGGARHHGMHRVRSRHHTGVKAMKPKALAYPPPIEGGAPDAVNDVFASLDAQQWAAFMPQLRAEIDDALAAGIWRAERSPGPAPTAMGTSCPRF